MATRLRGLSRAGDATAGLPHYFSVLAGRARPHYQLCKFIPVPESVQLHEDGEEELWRVHEQLMHVHEDLRQHPVEPNACPVSPHLLDLKCELAHRIIRQCCLCENACGDDRTVNTGKCGVGERPKISSHFAHHGEEEELVPSYTTFFSGCNFMCQFCQNCDISQNPQEGTEFTPHEYAQMIPRLTKRTHARNLNWVGGEPTPNAPFILDVLNALPVDFNLSSIWNSNMFYSEKCGILLAGTQDVYLGDLKYGTDKCCWRLSKRRGYTQAVHRNFVFAQKHGDLLIRHLVLPNHLECCTAKCMEFVAQDLGTITRVNVMFQYRPEFNAYEIEDIARCLTTEECHRALQLAHAAGLTNLCRDV